MNAATLPMFNLKHLKIGIAMLVAAGLAVFMTPVQKVAEEGPKLDLETMIPKQIGEWRVDESIVPLQVSPDVQAKLDSIYNQMLSRTYIDNKGNRVMLSIAYGGDQRDSMKAHRPEVCYPAQGFQVVKQMEGTLQSTFGEITVKRLVAEQGKRIEPITYWFVTGGMVNATNLDRKISQIKFGLTGSIPDGLLFRVSSICLLYTSRRG